jgi:hypothetical protein
VRSDRDSAGEDDDDDAAAAAAAAASRVGPGGVVQRERWGRAGATRSIVVVVVVVVVARRALLAPSADATARPPADRVDDAIPRASAVSSAAARVARPRAPVVAIANDETVPSSLAADVFAFS